MYKVGIDIGGTKITLGVFDAATKQLIKSEKLYIKDIESIVVTLKQTVFRIINDLGGKYSDIESVGIGIPGTVSSDGKKILKAPNISKLTENFVVELEKELSLPITMIQDSRAAAWGEYLCGGGQGYSCVICVTLGTGIGTGMVIDGKIYSGALGAAGELGHLPVVENGRKCGCGRHGCVEKYSAGGGLDITARELLGDSKTAADLFDAVKLGNKDAKKVLEEAVIILGRALTSIINLISPDCLLFSGGLSEQEELYLNPLIKYITEHCYNATELPKISKAALGEYSPLYGAAFVPTSERKRKPMLSASVMCADILDLGNELKNIENAGIDWIHCDIMDNNFVPNMMLPPELLNKLRKSSDLTFDYHIMAEKPETIVEQLNLLPGDYVSVHYESTVHLQRVITLIKNKGAKASVAINPATPIWALDEILPELDMVLIMTVNPGFAGQKIVPTAFEKISKMRKMLRDRGFENIIIQADGNCSFENVPKMYKAGADVFVVGTSSVFKPGESIKDNTAKLKSLIGG